MNPIDEADFWSHVDIRGVEECWPWKGKPNRFGYGRYRGEYAHRIAYELGNGPLDGLCSLHACDNPPCQNPSHLFKGTKRDNANDMISKGRHRGGGGRKPDCPRGHAYEPDNYYVTSSGSRQCKTCQRARSASRYYVKKCAALDTIATYGGQQ